MIWSEWDIKIWTLSSSSSFLTVHNLCRVFNAKSLYSFIQCILIRFVCASPFMYCFLHLKQNSQCIEIDLFQFAWLLFCFPLSTIPILIEGVHIDWNFKLKTQTHHQHQNDAHEKREERKKERKGNEHSNQLYVLFNFNLDYMIESRYNVAAK